MKKMILLNLVVLLFTAALVPAATHLETYYENIKNYEIASITDQTEAQRILLYDFPSYPHRNIKSRSRAALDRLSLPYTIGEQSTFNSLLQEGTWDLVVIDCPSTDPSTWAPLVDYINSGGKVVMSFWNLNSEASLADAFGVSVTSSFNTPQNVYRWDPNHPIFNIPNLVGDITSWEETANDDGDKLMLTSLSDAQALAGFTISPTAGQAAIVLGNRGLTIYNGFLFDEVRNPTGINLVANEIMYIIARPGVSPIADAGDDMIAAANEEVTLDGSASYDPDGEIIRYTWKRLPDEVVIYSGEYPNCQTRALGRAEEIIELTVTDNYWATATDTVRIVSRTTQNLQNQIAAMQSQIEQLQQQIQELQALVDKIVSWPPIRQWLRRTADGED